MVDDVVNDDAQHRGEPQQDALLMVPIATALLGADGRILHWSGDAEALLGYSAEQALGARAADLLATDEQRSEVLQLFGQIQAGRPWTGVFPVRHRDGHAVQLEFHTHAITVPGAVGPLVLAVAAEVTTLRRIQSDLAVLDGFFTQSPVGMGVFDSELRFVRLNEALARANGLPAEQHLGRRISELLPGTNGAEAEEAMRRVLASGVPVLDARAHGRTMSDPRREHAWSASYFRLQDRGGRVLGVSATVVDITARFRADARAARAQERLTLLVDATASIGTTLDLHQTARELADAMVPQVADVSGVFALEALVAGRSVEPPDPQAPMLVRRLALATDDPLYPAEALPVDALYELPPDSPYARALATGRTVVVPPLLSDGVTESRRRAFLGDRPRSVRITPLVARGTTLGMVVYSRRGARESFAEADITLGEELASRAAVALDNARLYLRQHQTVLARQQALREAKAAQERLALVNVASTRIGTTLEIDRTAQELAEVATPRLADTVVVEILDGLVHGEREAAATTDGSALLRRMAFHSVPGSTLSPIARLGGVHRFPPGSPYAWCLEHREPVLVPRMDEQGLAWFADDPVRTAAIREQNVRSFMVVPLIARGTPIGVAGFYRTLVDRPYVDEDLALAGELAVRAAVSIDNALLYTRERDASDARQRALDEARAAQQRLSLLNEATARIGTTLDLHRTARELVEVVLPRFADFVTVDLRDTVLGGEEPGPVPADGAVLMRAVAVGDVTGGDGALTVTADQVGESSQSAQVYAESLRTRRSILISEVTEADMRRIAASPDRVEPGLSAGVHSYLMVPLVARGVVLGGAEFIRTRNPVPFGPEDRSLAEELVSRTALAIDNARLYRRERDTALMLQRSLLPQEIHRTLGLEIAYRYLPSSVVSEVGGDWFDVVPLAAGRVALIVGDVMGHGIRAAATMGQLRTVARTLITLDLDPARVMYRLDEATTALGEGQFATCVCVVYDPADRSCTAACAGHLPPVVADTEGRADLVELPPGAPLGVGGVPFDSAEFTLPEEAILTLYTDGLVERRGHDLDEGLQLLCRTVADRRRTLEQTCDAVLTRLTGPTSEDDIAVLMAQVRPAGADRIASLPLTGDREMVAHSRRFARETLESWGLGALADWAELLTSELITNALVHAGSPTQLRLFCNRTLTVEVADRESEVPRMRRAHTEDEGGRGIHLVNELAHRWGSRRTRNGKVVWFELELPPGSTAA
ncbi:SpoIIE family protein phosphatase [Streptomyces sp. NRRL WC-3742]|uniref:SpoIIE family protein phosphatase n=1 Tax=Streptomyces sp. NRRL WC-3742 TaxID=1463934 RepID=UPI00068CEB90|nr:SpoIIE family protein phosphatase [Streptomyces sp. NRRL WC-3742]